MSLPIGIFTALGKTGYALYSYWRKGAKIDASLTFVQSKQIPKGASSQNPADEPVFVGDAIFVFDFVSEYRLTLKNASNNPAYNIKLLNHRDIFSRVDQLPDLASLEPGASLTLRCTFQVRNVHIKSGTPKDKYMSIPESQLNKPLIISYQNEARATFYTKFKATIPIYTQRNKTFQSRKA